MSLDTEFTKDDIIEAFKKGFNNASQFMDSNPTVEEILDRIERLKFAGFHAAENFRFNLYNERNNAKKPNDKMKSMLSCVFRACEELRIIEEQRFDEHSNVQMIRADYLNFEILLPEAVTVFRTKGKDSRPDTSVLNDVQKIDRALHAA